MPNEKEATEKVLKQIDVLLVHLYKGLSGSERAKKRARVQTIVLQKLMKQYRIITVKKDI